jgi:hypothetical protein|tara:strand:+ start:581 stop:757 length:177 start_codon:yes stop_codon:yes gene_type:complete
MWVLVWLALEANQKVDYYHIGTYDTDKECQVSLKEAVVLVTNSNQSLACLYVGEEADG